MWPCRHGRLTGKSITASADEVSSGVRETVELAEGTYVTFRSGEYATGGIPTIHITSDAAKVDSRHLDETDSYVILGSTENIVETVEENRSHFPDLTEKSTGAEYASFGGVTNPENSSTPGKGILIDSESVEEWSESVEHDVTEGAAFLILHGIGHNSGISHSNSPNLLSAEGGVVQIILNPELNGKLVGEDSRPLEVNVPGVNTISDLTSKSSNPTYGATLKKRFGDSEPQNNYVKNGGAPPKKENYTSPNRLEKK